MCDIPQPEKPGFPTCATPAEANDPTNISLTQAGTALANGQSKSFALDWSAAAKADCGGLPKKIAYMGPFPDGLTLCINCGAQIPLTYANPTKACIAKCKDLINYGNGPMPAEGTDAYCEANARTATNFLKDACYDGACSSGGTPLPGFVDPRRTPEKVQWIDLIGTTDNGGTNSLMRTAPTTGPLPVDWNAGAASVQTILGGDAWVEFEAGEIGLAHGLALRNSCADPMNNCPDIDPSLVNMGFLMILASDNQVYTAEAGASLTVHGPFGPYAPGERYRVRALDNHDGTATISFSRLTAPCIPGTVCAETVLATSPAPSTVFPLRVDASFRDQNATLANVTLVRIH